MKNLKLPEFLRKCFVTLLIISISQCLFAQQDSLSNELLDHIRYHYSLNIDGRYHKYYETQSLIEAGANVNAVNKKGYSAVHLCAVNGDLINLKLLYYYKADFNKKNKDGKTALQLAEEKKRKIVVEFLKKPVLDGYFYAGHGTFEELKTYVEKNIKEINKPSRYGNTMLFYATGRNKDAFEVTKYLIRKGADVNFGYQDILDVSIIKKDLDLIKYYVEKNPSGTSGRPLNIAIGTKNYNIVKLLIDNGADVNKKDIHGYSPLYYAFIYQEENHDIIKLLIEKGADVNALNGDHTALFLAVGLPYYDDPGFDYFNYNIDTLLVKLLLENGADFKLKDRYDETPLSYALKNKNSYYALKLFVKYGADDDLILEYRNDLFFQAIGKNDLETVKLMIGEGVNINSENNYGSAPIHVAVSNNASFEMIKFLTEKGADLNAKRDNNETPLYLAAKNSKDPEIIKYLIENGADINAKHGYSDNTPLSIAIKKNKVKIAELLIDMGADFNKHNKDEALYLATKNETGLDMLKMLLENGVEANSRFYGTTPLHLTSKNKNGYELVKLLINNGANVNALNKSNQTPLDLAVYSGNLKIMTFLLENEADVKTRRSAKTPLHYAAENKEGFETVKLLIEKGANVNAIDNNNKTPLHYAILTGDIKTIELLKQKQTAKKNKKKKNLLMHDELIIYDRIPLDSTNYLNTGIEALDNLLKNFYYECENIGNINFPELLFEQFSNKEFKTYRNYEPFKGYDENVFKSKSYNIQEIRKRFGAFVDSSYVIEPETGEITLQLSEKNADLDQIIGIICYDKWYIDDDNIKIYKEPKAYSLLRRYYRDDDIDYEDPRYKLIAYLVFDDNKKSADKKMKLFKKVKYEFYLSNTNIYEVERGIYHFLELDKYYEKRNSPFWTSYGREKLKQFIFDKVITEELNAYDFYSEEKLSVKQIYKRFDAGIDTIFDIDPETGETIPIIQYNSIDFAEVESVIFIENWYIDEGTLRIKKEVVGIAPVRIYYNPEDYPDPKPIRTIPFVIYFDESKRF